MWNTPLTGLVSALGRAHLRLRVKDKWLRRQLTPEFTPGCKRMLMSSDYYPALQRENCKLIDWPIATLSPVGIRTSDGIEHEVELKDRRVAGIVKKMQALPGQHLFQYLDEDGARCEVTSGDINLYLKEISGADITAKDFRTWTGTVLAAMALSEYEMVDSEAAAKRNVRSAIEAVARRLGNTPTVCRKCYVHPEIVDSYLSAELVLEARQQVEDALRGDLSGLRAEEALVLSFLHRRLEQRQKR